MASSGIKIVYGPATLQGVGTLEKSFDIIEAAGIKELDTARMYGRSEEHLGNAKAADRFAISTKAKGGFVAGSLKKEAVLADMAESLKLLGVEKVALLISTLAYLEGWLESRCMIESLAFLSNHLAH